MTWVIVGDDGTFIRQFRYFLPMFCISYQYNEMIILQNGEINSKIPLIFYKKKSNSKLGISTSKLTLRTPTKKPTNTVISLALGLKLLMRKHEDFLSHFKVVFRKTKL